MNIADRHYDLALDDGSYVYGRLDTLPQLTLRNGFTVVGESASVSVENFDEELGRKIARSHARDKIWALEGYLLRDRVFVNERCEWRF